MSSSEAIPTRARRRWWSVVFVVLLAIAYCVGWFVLKGRIEDGIDKSLARLAERGIVAQCLNRDVSGFPLGLSLDCESIDYDDPARGIAFNVGALETQTTVYNPLRTDVTLAAPLRLETPNVPPIAVNWDNLRATARLSRPVPQKSPSASTAFGGDRPR
jgi:hypothetical protein